jgi:hypothetical protein
MANVREAQTASSSGAQKLPFIGNLLVLLVIPPRQTQLRNIYKMAKRTRCVIYLAHPSRIHYLMLSSCMADSDIIHVNALGTSMVILNSSKVATELLLDERSSIYSNR